MDILQQAKAAGLALYGRPRGFTLPQYRKIVALIENPNTGRAHRQYQEILNNPHILDLPEAEQSDAARRLIK